MLHGGAAAVALAPFVAKELAEAGLGKADVKRAPLARRAPCRLKSGGAHGSTSGSSAPASGRTGVREGEREGRDPRRRDPRRTSVVLVAGGDIPIPQCAYFPSWGFPRCLVSRRIDLPPDWNARLEQRLMSMT